MLASEISDSRELLLDTALTLAADCCWPGCRNVGGLQPSGAAAPLMSIPPTPMHRLDPAARGAADAVSAAAASLAACRCWGLKAGTHSRHSTLHSTVLLPHPLYSPVSALPPPMLLLAQPVQLLSPPANCDLCGEHASTEARIKTRIQLVCKNAHHATAAAPCLTQARLKHTHGYLSEAGVNQQ